MRICSSRILPVILCGGVGRRLFPLSSPDKPKQFHPLAHNDLSLLQQTILRVSDETRFASPVLFGNIHHQGHIKAQLAAIGCVPSALFLEPIMRNTAAPVVLSALYARKEGFDKVLVLPSDHHIQDVAAFVSDVESASMDDAVISYFGIAPDRPYTGYGYIQNDSEGIVFHEKPDIGKAAALILNGALWNSGIFLLNVAAFLGEAARIMPDLYEALLNGGFESYPHIPSVSFDKAFCERTSIGRLHKASFDWMDMGSMESLEILKAAGM